MRSYLIETGLMERLATAGVVTHLIWDGIFKSISVTDAALHVETLRRDIEKNSNIQGHFLSSSMFWSLLESLSTNMLSQSPSITCNTHSALCAAARLSHLQGALSLHFRVMRSFCFCFFPLFPWSHPLRETMACKKKKKNQHLVNPTFLHSSEC